MFVLLSVLGSLGGLVALIAGGWVIVRSIVRLVNATETNSAVVTKLTEKISEHGERIARLEGRAP